MSHNTQVGLERFPVLPDASQRAARHGDNGPPGCLCRDWERRVVCGLLLIPGRLMGQAVFGGDAMSEKTHKTMMPVRRGRRAGFQDTGAFWGLLAAVEEITSDLLTRETEWSAAA